jgi:hypothetical protein
VTLKPSYVTLELSGEPLDRGEDSFSLSAVTLESSVVAPDFFVLTLEPRLLTPESSIMTLEAFRVTPEPSATTLNPHQ